MAWLKRTTTKTIFIYLFVWLCFVFRGFEMKAIKCRMSIQKPKSHSQLNNTIFMQTHILLQNSMKNVDFFVEKFNKSTFDFITTPNQHNTFVWYFAQQPEWFTHSPQSFSQQFYLFFQTFSLKSLTINQSILIICTMLQQTKNDDAKN